MSDLKDREEEKTHIKHALCWNSYSLDPALNQVGLSAPAETTAVEPLVLDKTKKSYTVVVIPYVKGLSEQIRRVMRGYGVKVYFKPTNTFR